MSKENQPLQLKETKWRITVPTEEQKSIPWFGIPVRQWSSRRHPTNNDYLNKDWNWHCAVFLFKIAKLGYVWNCRLNLETWLPPDDQNVFSLCLKVKGCKIFPTWILYVRKWRKSLGKTQVRNWHFFKKKWVKGSRICPLSKKSCFYSVANIH